MRWLVFDFKKVVPNIRSMDVFSTSSSTCSGFSWIFREPSIFAPGFGLTRTATGGKCYGTTSSFGGKIPWSKWSMKSVTRNVLTAKCGQTPHQTRVSGSPRPRCSMISHLIWNACFVAYQRFWYCLFLTLCLHPGAISENCIKLTPAPVPRKESAVQTALAGLSYVTSVL